MRNPRFINTLLISLVSLSALSQATGRPKLVLGITVDQLRTDPLEQLRTLFGEKGFRRLMEKGVYLQNLDFGAGHRDKASGTAQLYTGSYAPVHGIPSETIYDVNARRSVGTLSPGGSYSPSSILLSTVADEIAIDGIGLGAIYSIAANPEIAIIAGGHASNCAIWLDEESGKWTSSAYYSDVPRSLAMRNRQYPLAGRIDTMQWKPLLELSRYPGIPAQKRQYAFRHTYPSHKRDTYSKFGESPQGNREVTDFAIQILESENLGRRGDAIDMLNVGYSLAPCREVYDGDYRLEQQDAYLRLDLDLARLLNAADKAVGLDNVMVWLLPTGYYNDAVANDSKYRIQGGEFSVKKATSLLNSYLGAKYGNADWVVGFHDNQFYFNTRSLENCNIASEREILSDARDFLLKMSGVAAAYTIYDILSASTNELQALRENTDASKAGQLRVKIRPGSILVTSNGGEEHRIPVRESSSIVPGFILHPEIGAHLIPTAVDAVEIAPTLTRILRIRAPNGAEHKGLTF